MKINNCSACKESHDGIFIVTPPERTGPGFLCPKTNTWVTIISVAPSMERVGGQLDFVSVGFSTLDDDPINPQHYHRMSGHEVIDVLLAWGLGFTLGNAVKYIARHALKGDPVGDLRKARWYLEHELSQLEPKAKPVTMPHEGPADYFEATDALARTERELKEVTESRDAYSRSMETAKLQLEEYRATITTLQSTKPAPARDTILEGELDRLQRHVKNVEEEAKTTVARLQYERDEWERKATHSVSVELHGKTVDEAKATLNAQLAEARHEVEAARKLVSETKMGSGERVLRRRLAKVIEAVDACKGDFKSLPVVKEIRAFAAGERDA